MKIKVLAVFFAAMLSTLSFCFANPFARENCELIKLFAEKNQTLDACKVKELDVKIKKLQFKKQRLLLKLLKPYHDEIDKIEAKKIKLETQGKAGEELGAKIEKIQTKVNAILKMYYIEKQKQKTGD